MKTKQTNNNYYKLSVLNTETNELLDWRPFVAEYQYEYIPVKPNVPRQDAEVAIKEAYALLKFTNPTVYDTLYHVVWKGGLLEYNPDKYCAVYKSWFIRNKKYFKIIDEYIRDKYKGQYKFVYTLWHLDWTRIKYGGNTQVLVSKEDVSGQQERNFRYL